MDTKYSSVGQQEGVLTIPHSPEPCCHSSTTTSSMCTKGERDTKTGRERERGQRREMERERQQMRERGSQKEKETGKTSERQTEEGGERASQREKQIMGERNRERERYLRGTLPKRWGANLIGGGSCEGMACGRCVGCWDSGWITTVHHGNFLKGKSCKHTTQRRAVATQGA